MTDKQLKKLTKGCVTAEDYAFTLSPYYDYGLEPIPGLFLTVARHIVERRGRLYMRAWHGKTIQSSRRWRDWREKNPDKIPNGDYCGTPHCLAGWIVAFASAGRPWIHFLDGSGHVNTGQLAMILCPELMSDDPDDPCCGNEIFLIKGSVMLRALRVYVATEDVGKFHDVIEKNRQFINYT